VLKQKTQSILWIYVASTAQKQKPKEGLKKLDWHGQIVFFHLRLGQSSLSFAPFLGKEQCRNRQSNTNTHPKKRLLKVVSFESKSWRIPTHEIPISDVCLLELKSIGLKFCTIL